MPSIRAPFGSWKSPVSSDLIASGTITLGQIVADGDDVYWLEGRRNDGGRNVIVRRTRGGETTDVTPAPFNARTCTHEYGGGDFTVCDGTVYFSNFADQRVYLQAPGGTPQPITPSLDCRYADLAIDRRRQRLLCVREDHTDRTREASNTLVSLDLVGATPLRVLASGNDFYSSARLSPDGGHLAWLTWNHPNMPWDGTELWVGVLAGDGSLAHSQRIAGGPSESIFQPEWSPDGVLYFISDRSGWWNLCRWRNRRIEPLCPRPADFGRPQWVFGMSTYAFESAASLICTYAEHGTWNLARLDTVTQQFDRLDTPYSEILNLRDTGDGLVFFGGAPTQAAAIVRMRRHPQAFEVLRHATDVHIDAGYLSRPEAIEFSTAGGRSAHAFFYPPYNRGYHAPDADRPPLLVKTHGGPTAAASSALDLRTQYWTSRGIAVVDVNYGGSSGFGRAYRQRLDGQWGLVDVADCVHAALYLADRGAVDRQCMAISGGSAGGYTTLCALTFYDVFKAGASYYGIGDLEALATDTHKFEAHYTDRLIGPYPAERDLYRERSPIHFVDRLSCPVIFFQGLDDRVVPPNQAQAMVQALCARGLPVSYLPFAGEQHGFRRAENIKRALDSELYFYSRVFGFTLGEPMEPVPIKNLDDAAGSLQR